MRPHAFGLAAAAVLVAVAPARADDPAATVVTLQVGEATPVGPAPVRQLICDDGNVVEVVDAGTGPALRARAPGTTLCSFVDSLSVRRVYRITVREVAPDEPGDAPRKPHG